MDGCFGEWVVGDLEVVNCWRLEISSTLESDDEIICSDVVCYGGVFFWLRKLDLGLVYFPD